MGQLRRSFVVSCCVGLFLLPSLALAFDEFDDGYSPTHFQLRSRYLTLTLKGELELELHDLEGRGGPGFDSPTDTRTIGTRSPFVEIDSLWLALRIGFPANISVNSYVELTVWDARVGAVWLDYRGQAPSWLEHHVEVGYHTPIVTIDRRSERYPLLGSIYWRQPELHAAWTGTFQLTSQISIDLGLSVAMMRPLDFSGVQESSSQPGTINILSYGAARAFSGNRPVLGGRLRLLVYGAFIEGFAFTGRLASEAGTDVLRSGFPNYRDLPGYDGEAEEDAFFWAGGRVGYEGAQLRAMAEGIGSREGLIRRWGVYAQASYAFQIRPEASLFHTLETLVRWETYRISGSAEVGPNGRALRSPAPINAVSWDYDVLTVSLITDVYRDLVKLRLELAMIWESNGVPDDGVANEPFRNNELLAHVELRF